MLAESVIEDGADQVVEAEEHLHRLRGLLLSDELRELPDLQRRTEALERSMTGVLRHAKAASLSSVEERRIVRSLRPQMGRLLRGSVLYSLGRLGARIDRFVDALLSWRLMKLRLKAVITGQSMRELVDSELRRTEVRRLYLVMRETGVLLYHWSNADFVAGPTPETVEEILTTAHVMTEFAPDRRDVPLRAMNLSESLILLQASSRHVVVSEINEGTISEERKAIFAHAFRMMLDAAAAHRDPDPQSLERETFTAFATPLVSQQTARKDRRAKPAHVLALCAMLAAVVWYGWRLYHQTQITRAANAIEETVLRNFRPGDVMVEVGADRARRRISVMGLGFGPGDVSTIERRARTLAGPYALDFNLVMRDLAGARLERDALAASLSDAQIAVAAARKEMARMNSGAGEASASRVLREWADGNAVFFGVGINLRDEAFTDGQLDTLAALMEATPDSRLRVEGFTAGDNRLARNARTAKARALVVADRLVQRGIAPGRLNPMGGHKPFPAISEGEGTATANDRVEFSLAFTGE